MTKDELIRITLKQLHTSFKESPECFQLEDASVLPTRDSYPGPTIIWRFRTEVNGEAVQDPNNAARTIIVSYNSLAKQLSCYIFFKEVNNLSSAVYADAKAEIKWEIPILHSSYRQFMKLRDKLIKRIRDKENFDYLRKLNSIFPTAFTDDLLE